MKRNIILKSLCIFLCFAIVLGMPLSSKTAFADSNKVYLGGCPIGVDLEIDGLMVIGKADVFTEEGLSSPAKVVDIERGDIIKKVNGKDIYKSKELTEAVSSSATALMLELSRKGKKILTYINPVTEASSGKKKIGLIVKDRIQGIGTLTFMREDNSFGALGHPASSIKSDFPTPVKCGMTKSCVIMGVNKGEKGKAGELRGVIIDTDELRGVVFKNNKFGIFGKLDKKYRNPIYPNPVEVASTSEVKIGKATILSTMDGKTVKEYEIEIVSKDYQSSPDEKGMVINVTDKELLKKSGGIVQGMSGSPIIQNGKFVGAVTHVFINDPTRGYGLYGKFMEMN